MAQARSHSGARTFTGFLLGAVVLLALLIGWCGLRGDFRSFRTDRVVDAAFLDERYPERPTILRAKWRKTLGKPKAA